MPDSSDNVDLANLYEAFLSAIPQEGRILDLTPAGKAALEFRRRDRDAVAAGVDDINDEEATFDGIWCLHGLVHMPRGNLKKICERLARALKPEGVFYLSFTRGSKDRTVAGQIVVDQTEESLLELLAGIETIDVRFVWRTRDPRLGHQEEWANALVVRRPLGVERRRAGEQREIEIQIDHPLEDPRAAVALAWLKAHALWVASHPRYLRACTRAAKLHLVDAMFGRVWVNEGSDVSWSVVRSQVVLPEVPVRARRRVLGEDAMAAMWTRRPPRNPRAQLLTAFTDAVAGLEAVLHDMEKADVRGYATRVCDALYIARRGVTALASSVDEALPGVLAETLKTPATTLLSPPRAANVDATLAAELKSAWRRLRRVARNYPS